MDLSIFLARFFGIYFLVVSGAYFARGSSFRLLLKEYVANSALVLLAGSMALILGTFLILLHSKWRLDWSLSITLVSYLTFFKGVLIFIHPETGKKIAAWFYEEGRYRYLSPVSLLLSLSFFSFSGLDPLFFSKKPAFMLR